MNGRRILVADDYEDEVRDLIERLKHCYEVKYVTDGRQALEEIKTEQFDAAILDDSMLPKDVGGYADTFNKFYGREIAKFIREKKLMMAVVLRSQMADTFQRELEHFGVYCHSKSKPDDPSYIISNKSLVLFLVLNV